MSVSALSIDVQQLKSTPNPGSSGLDSPAGAAAPCPAGNDTIIGMSTLQRTLHCIDPTVHLQPPPHHVQRVGHCLPKGAGKGTAPQPRHDAQVPLVCQLCAGSRKLQGHDHNTKMFVPCLGTPLCCTAAYKGRATRDDSALRTRGFRTVPSGHRKQAHRSASGSCPLTSRTRQS